MLLLGDCLEQMRKVPDNSIDLVITSPPYAMQRKDTYGGIEEGAYPAWMEEIGKEIHRILKPTGNFVLNIKENAKNGARSTYVMETVILLSKIFLWKDTYIWHKRNPFPTGSNRRLKDAFEYCYWFTKSGEYKFFPEHVLEKSNSKYTESEKRRKNRFSHECKNGSGFKMNMRSAPDMVRPSNVITLTTDNENHVHPATFPVKLPQFFIKLMTEQGDTVLDPFMGSGTTGVAAAMENREFIGIEILDKYMEIARDRIQKQLDKGYQVNIFDHIRKEA